MSFEAFLSFRLDLERKYQVKNNTRFAPVVFWGLSTRLFATGYAFSSECEEYTPMLQINPPYIKCQYHTYCTQ